MKAATGGVSGWPSSQATPISRAALGAVTVSSTTPGRGTAGGGSRATPRPAATRPRRVSASSPSKATRGREAGLLAQVVGDAAQAVAGFEGDEGFVGGLGEADALAGGEAVVVGDDQAQPLLVEAAGDQVGGVRDG